MSSIDSLGSIPSQPENRRGFASHHHDFAYRPLKSDDEKAFATNPMLSAGGGGGMGRSSRLDSILCYPCMFIWRRKSAVLMTAIICYAMFLLSANISRCDLRPFTPSTSSQPLRSQPILPKHHQTNTSRLIPFLKANDFGDPVEVEMRFANYNETYNFRRPLVDVCKGIKVLIIVVSGPTNFFARQTIRDTWMHDEINPTGYRTLFLIGKRMDPLLDARIQMEQDTYGDIVRYDALDSYERLFVKTHAAFSWQQNFCPNASYLVKTDDDTVLHMQRLDYYINKEFDKVRDTHPKTFFCNVFRNSRPFRNPTNRWFVSQEEYHGRLYPSFCQGCSYMASTAAIDAVLEAAPNVAFLHLEDVLMTGLLVKNASGVRHHAAFGFGHDSPKPCDEKGVPYILTRYGITDWKLNYEYDRIKKANCTVMGRRRPVLIPRRHTHLKSIHRHPPHHPPHP